MTEYEILSLQQANRDFYLNFAVAIITFISLSIVYWDYRSRKSKEKAEKSIRIAEDFAKNIIARISIISGFFEKYELDKIINKVNFYKFTDFDYDELKQLYNESEITNYENILKENDKEYTYKKIIVDTLNELEYMCMYIATKVADEKYIYNSLHQPFIKCISLLYFNISLINTDNKDKYYTNIIQVFNIWKNKYIKAEKREKKIKKKLKPSLHKIV